MHYYLYEIRNNLNGKIYVGVHKTESLDDGYMGSGKVIRSSIEKNGLHNFTKTVLEEFGTAEEMYAREAEIVNEEFLAREDVYNLRRGGNGGFDYINANPDLFLTEKRLSSLMPIEETRLHWRKKFETDENFRDIIRRNSKMGNEAALKKFPKSGFYGKSHSDETKQKISENSKIKQRGEGNSQFGSRWITNGEVSKKIGKEELIPDGWKSGRVIRMGSANQLKSG